MAARARLSATLAVVSTATALALVPATTSDASPHQTAAEVKAQIKTLEAQERQAQQAEAQQRAALSKLRAQQALAAAELASEHGRVEALRVRIAATADYAYRSGGVGGVAGLAQIAGPTALLSATTLDQYAGMQADQLDALAKAQRQAETTRAQLAKQTKQAQKALSKLTAASARIARLLNQAHTLLSSLSPAPAPARASRSAQRVALPRVSSARVAAVLRFADAQLGKPYQYGAAGPSSYDCSGLTMRAWGVAGVSLPHNAASQQSMLHPVHGALQPGDLVFEGSPAYHVGIYIGGGRMIHAPQTGDVVKIAPLPAYSSAGRP